MLTLKSLLAGLFKLAVLLIKAQALSPHRLGQLDCPMGLPSTMVRKLGSYLLL
jgi:hypothetical protein